MKTAINKSVLYTISFLDLLAVGLIVPLLPVHLRSLGASRILIGVLGSTYSAIQVLSGPIIGSVSDIKGRKSVLLLSLLPCSLLYLAFGSTESLCAIFCIRLLLGLVKHTQTLCKALVVDGFPPKHHAAIFGQMTALSSIGFVLGPFAGGHLHKLQNGFTCVCYLSAFMFVVNLGLTFTLPDKKWKEQDDTKLGRKTINKVQIISNMVQPINDLLNINWSMYGDGLALKFLFGFATSIYYTNYSLYMSEKYGLSQLYIGYIISFQGTVAAMSSFLMGIINKTIYKNNGNSNKRILHAFILLTFSLISLYFASNIYAFIFLLVPFAIANAFTRIVSTEILITNSKEDERGAISGTSNSAMSLARMLAPISSGIVYEVFGKNSVIFFAMLPSIVGTIWAYKLATLKIKTS